jgi:anthranilate phosphoribosyltransferase
MAGVLGRLGCDRAMVVSSQDGLDELSISAPTSVAELDEAGDVTFYQIDPASFGIGPYEKGSLAGGTPEENAEISLEFLSGAVGPVRDAALLNAAAAIMLAGSVNDMAEGLAAAAEAVDSGAAMTVLEGVRDICREDA